MIKRTRANGVQPSMVVIILNGHREEFSLVPKLTRERIRAYREKVKEIREMILTGVQEPSNSNSCNINDLSPKPFREDQTVAECHQQWFSQGPYVNLFSNVDDALFNDFQ
jgi:hypothetical protein